MTLLRASGFIGTRRLGWRFVAAISLAACLAVPAAAEPPRIELRAGDRVVLVGNTLAERMQLFNHFETLLMAQFPDRTLAVRNLGWSADTLTLEPRPLNFGTTPTHLYRLKADVILAFFGANESFAGEPGLPQFEQELDGYLRGHQSAKYNGASPVRVVLVSPIAHERLARLPDVNVEARNTELARYTEAMRRVAAARGVVFVDLFTPTLRLMSAAGSPLTINGLHLNELGDRIVGMLLMEALGFAQGARVAAAPEVAKLDALREVIGDKNRQFFHRFRPVNGEYVYGRRVEPFGSVNFPAEMKQLDEMVAERDRQIWARAKAVRGLTYPNATPASGVSQ